MPVDPQNDRAGRVALAKERDDGSCEDDDEAAARVPGLDPPRAVSAKALLVTLAEALRTPIALVLSPLEDALDDDEEPLSARQQDRIALSHRSGQRLLGATSALLELARTELGREALTRAVADAFRAPIERTGISLAPLRDDRLRERSIAWAQRDPSKRRVAHAQRDRFDDRFEGTAPGVGRRRAEPRILVADDNPEMRAYIAQLLAPSYDVETVSDGRAALEAARARPPDLVLTDITMPGMDGFALVGALRADHATRVVPVIFLSASADESARLEALDAGVDDYLGKPFVARELLARVSAHLASARARRRVLGEAAGAVAEARAAQAVAEEKLAKLEARLREPRLIPAIGALTEGAVTILVVEDEELARRLARRVLENAGFHVLEAENGREALDLVAREPGIRLVVSDLVMPEVGGRDLGKYLRDRGFAYPVLYMTGYDGEHVARHALLDAGAPFLQKPFPPERLVHEVRSLLERFPIIPGTCTKKPMIPFE